MKFILILLLTFFSTSLLCVDLPSYSPSKEDTMLAKKKKKRKKRRKKKRRKRYSEEMSNDDSSGSSHSNSSNAYFTHGGNFKSDLNLAVSYKAQSSKVDLSTEGGSSSSYDGESITNISFDVTYLYNITPNIGVGPSISYLSISYEYNDGASLNSENSLWVLGGQVNYNFFDINREKWIPYAALMLGMGSLSQKTGDAEPISTSVMILPSIELGAKFKFFSNAYIASAIFWEREVREETTETSTATTTTKTTFTNFGLKGGIGMFF